jgi:hypothetical protein
MIRRSSARLIVFLAALPFAGGASAFAQPAGGDQTRPRYDLSAETTVTGTIQSVEQITDGSGAGRRGLVGTHLVLETGKETVAVHLGPKAFLDEQKVAIAKGETVEIVGSRVTVDGDGVLIAKSVKKGETVWTLRDASGLPLWRRGRR